MSAPPLHKPPAMPTMVSRLPKFGSKPKSAAPSHSTQTITGATAGTFTGSAPSSTRLTNGFYHHPGPAVNGSLTALPTAVKQNGFIRVPTSFSMKWRESEKLENGGNGGNGANGGNGGNGANGGNGGKELGKGRTGNAVQNSSVPCYSQRKLGSPVVSQREPKKPAVSPPGKGRDFGLPVTPSSSSPSPQSSPRTRPGSKAGSHGSRPNKTAFGFSNGTKPALNDLFGSRPRSGTTGSLRPPQNFARSVVSRPGSGPGSRSGSPLQKKPQASRSHSTDSLGSAPSVQLTEGDRFRSRSLTQVRRQPSPTLTPSSTSSFLTRSPTSAPSFYSASKASGRGGPAKTAVSNQSPEGEGRAGGVKVQGSTVPRSGVSIPSLLPPSALKKPLLPTLSSASKPSGISYKLSRPSINKQARPLRVTPTSVSGGDLELNGGPTSRRGSVETPSTTENSPGSPEAPEKEGLTVEAVSQGDVSIVGETLEDMSLSSNSSLDRNDTSQEYMDDFDNLGNGGVGILLLSSKNDEDDSGLDQSCTRYDEDKVAVRDVAKATGLCFLDDGVDWTSMRLSGEQGEQQLTRLPHRRKSSQPDLHEQGGSSLDLSPSDSCGSGGTYMWDEEGLEPLGGAAQTTSINANSNSTHHIGSFDSDLNSIDILNDLDSDLDDDDLMLDADVLEDASLHSDGDGISHMAQWRRRQLCWGTQDVHADNESDFQCYKLTEDPGNKRTDQTRDLILDLCPPRSPCLSPGTPGLGLDVEELAEDCSAVRSQLEYLRTLLLQEEDVDDDTLTTDTLSPEAGDSAHSSDSQVQVQALQQEVQLLREELRSRDRTIAQLTLQLTVPSVTSRCRCRDTTETMDRHTQTSVTEKESVASQTPWREHTSQILHSSGPDEQEPLTDQSPAPPPSIRPDSPAHDDLQRPHSNAIDPLTEGAKDCGRAARREEERAETKERRMNPTRSLQPPQPSRLRLFLSQTSGSASPLRMQSAVAPPPDPESGGTSGVRVRTSAFPFGSSRLPKPKSH